MTAARPPRVCTGVRCGVRHRTRTMSTRWDCSPARRSGSSRCTRDSPSSASDRVCTRHAGNFCTKGVAQRFTDAPTVETMTTDAHRSRPLRFGLHTALPRGAEFGAFAISVQEAGFDVLTIPDHLVASLSPFPGATAAAVATAHLRTGTLVLNNDLRHPVETAREAATVAAISGGRFELGL